VLGQPLLWAPLLGLAVRAWGGAELALLGPIAASAAPVALFVLGLYLHAERRRLGELRAGDLAVIGLRLVGLPVLTAALALAGRAAGLVDADTAAVVVLLAGMPAAITTFAIATELEVATERVARAVVGSTALSAATLPILAWLARSLAG
jgi:predicted permease